MRAVIAAEAGGPEVLSVGELPDVSPGPGEVLLDDDCQQPRGLDAGAIQFLKVYDPVVQRRHLGCVTQMPGALKRDVVLLSAAGGDLAVAAAWPPDAELNVTDMTAARWAMEKGEPAGNGTGTLPNSAFQFRPLGTPAGVAAVVGFRQARHEYSMPPRSRCSAPFSTRRRLP